MLNIKANFLLILLMGTILSACADISLVGEGSDRGAPAPYGVGADPAKTTITKEEALIKTKRPIVINTNSGGAVSFGSEDGFLAYLKSNNGRTRGAETIWDATVDSLSFMGVAKADEKNGDFQTNWYHPTTNKNRRVRIKADVNTKVLNSSSLKVDMEKQVYSGGSWKNVAVSPKEEEEIEMAIFKRVKQINYND